MPSSRYISNSVLRSLYVHSGNQCAFPCCCAPIFEDSGLLTGECCHIKAYSANGPRYDASQTDEERNSADNLILLCSRHHTIIDSDDTIYTNDVLQQYKREHEAKFSAKNLKLTEEQLQYLQKSNTLFWKRIKEIDKEDKDFIDLKMMVSTDKSVEDLLNDIEDLLKSIEDNVGILTEFESSLVCKIRDYLVEIGLDVTEYDKQLSSYPYNNPFLGTNWELLSLTIPNELNALWMSYFQVIVKIFEHISLLERKEHPLLTAYKERLIEYQKRNYYLD